MREVCKAVNINPRRLSWCVLNTGPKTSISQWSNPKCHTSWDADSLAISMQTLSSPRSMFAAQLIGAALAVFISPAAFWLYWSG